MEKTAFLQQAKQGNNGIIAYIVTFILLIIGNTFGTFPLMAIVLLSVKGDLSAALADLPTLLQDPVSAGVDTNLLFFGMLLTFVFMLGGLWLGVRYLHKRSFLSLINGYGAMRWERVFTAAAVWFGITALMELVNFSLNTGEYSLTFEPLPFAITLLISLLILPFQTSCEELIFRGWLMQGIGSVTRRAFVPLLIPAILFGVMHFANPEVAKFGLLPMAIYYIGFGLFMGLLTLLDDGLELSLGVHFGNNFFGATMVSFSSSALQTNTLFRTSDPNAYLLLALSVAGATAAFWFFKQKYGLADIKTLWEDRHKALQH